MNDLIVFKNDKLGSVRAVNQNDEAWFVGKDVAVSLGYTNPQKALRDHVDSEDKTVNDSFTVNGTPPILINESGLWSLVLSSKLPSAKAFKRWITHDVIPAIRKTGHYSTKPGITIDPEALTMIVSTVMTETAKQMVPMVGTVVSETMKQMLPLIKPEPEPTPKLRTRRPVLLKDFSDVLNQVMREQGVSGTEIAQRMKVSKQTVSLWKNRRNCPNQANYARFVMEFGVPVSELGEGVF